MLLDDRHTAEQLATHFLVAMDTRKIDKARCHHVVRDNAANIAKCFRDLEISSSGCFAHSLPLALNDGILSQRYVTDMLAVSRRLVGHFKHSSSATARLHQFQAQLNMPNHQLVQDVSTSRWNSSYYMMQRLLEQRQALALYAVENNLDGLSSNQWDVLKNVVGLLAPFEEATTYVSSNAVCISDSIPVLAGLRKRLQNSENDTGVKTMKAALLDALSACFQLNDKPEYTVATLLDPRYKNRFFSDIESQAVTHIVKAKLVAIQTQRDTALTGDTEGEPVLKKPRLGNAESSGSLFDCVDDLLDSSSQDAQSESATTPTSTTVAKDGNMEFARYMAEPLLSRTSDMLAWWRDNKGRFPLMASVARTYLGAPPSRVPSERLFSTAGGVITEHRTRLLPENAEKLIFMKFNGDLLKQA